jgi:hypothetical protein
MIACARGAVISDDEVFRYSLWRNWEDVAATAPSNDCCLWICLNPSTADALKDDATVRKCVGFAQRWGHTSIEIVNMYALRSRHPSKLKLVTDPVGPDNDMWLMRSAARSKRAIAAWGNHAVHLGRDRAVLRLLETVGVELLCLGTTNTGRPKHPLVLGYDTPLEPFRRSA